MPVAHIWISGGAGTFEVAVIEPTECQIILESFQQYYFGF